MKRLFAVICLLIALTQVAKADDYTCGIDTDGNGSVDRWCPPIDKDGDGFYLSSSGIEGPASKGTATVNGAQTTVTTITVTAGHTFATGKIAHFYDSVTAGNVDREVIDATPTTITIAGAAITVTNGLSITSQVQYDCDDENFYDYPGIVIDAGSGNVKTCQRDGTYTSSVAFSAYTCHTGSGQTYYIDDAGTTTCTGAGTYASPWHPRCILDASLAGYHTPVAGDCFLREPGNYSFSWSSGSKQWDVYNISGTAANRIKLISPQGYAVVDQATATNLKPFTFINANYWHFQGFKVDGNGIKTNVGLYMTPSSNSLFRNIEIKNIDGGAYPEGNNVSGLTLNGDASNNNIHHVYFHDNYDRDGTDYTNGNNRQFTAFEGTGNVLQDYVFIGKATTGTGVCAGYKHGEPGGNFKASRGRIRDCYSSGWEYNQPNSYFKNTLIVAGSLSNQAGGWRNYNVGGTPFYDNSLIENFTIVAGATEGGGISAQPFESSSAVGNPFLTAQDGIIQISRTSFYGDGTNAFFSIAHYASDTDCADLTGSPKFIFRRLKIHNPSGTGFFASICGSPTTGPGASAPMGTTYTSSSSLVTAGFASSLDVTDCSLDANTFIAGNPACYDYDWWWGNDTVGGGTTTTTTVATTTTTSTSSTTTTVGGTTTTIIGVTPEYAY